MCSKMIKKQDNEKKLYARTPDAKRDRVPFLSHPFTPAWSKCRTAHHSAVTPSEQGFFFAVAGRAKKEKENKKKVPRRSDAFCRLGWEKAMFVLRQCGIFSSFQLHSLVPGELLDAYFDNTGTAPVTELYSSFRVWAIKR